jgi:hypothetical protein
MSLGRAAWRAGSGLQSSWDQRLRDIGDPSQTVHSEVRFQVPRGLWEAEVGGQHFQRLVSLLPSPSSLPCLLGTWV